jgi:ankyrin repeat protein
MNAHYNLINAVYRSNLNQVKRLLSEGADVHIENDRALRIACSFGDFKIVKLLVEHGANINVVDENKVSIWMMPSNKNNEIKTYLNKQMLLNKINEYSTF